MRKSLVTISKNEPIKKAVKVIFNLRIGALPVVEDHKLVGFITRDDILNKLHPSIAEFMQDETSRNFEAMEKRLAGLMSKPVSQIMTTKVKFVNEDSPLMKAQSMMVVNDFNYLPVVNKKNELVGLISNGDIFRGLTGSEIPFESQEEYHDWLSGIYDLVVQWGKRLKPEIASLSSVFKKAGIRDVLDVGCGTGEHALALPKIGFNVLGLDRSSAMIRTCLKKYKNQPEKIQHRLQFTKGYIRTLSDRPRSFGSCIMMGNALAHYPEDYKNVLEKIDKSLFKKRAVLVLQINNFDKIFKLKRRLSDFNVAPSKISKKNEYAFVEYYDPPRAQNGNLTLNMSVTSFDGRRWSQAGINSTPIANIKRENIAPILKRLGFKKIDFYGNDSYQPLFKEKFDIKKHDFLNVLALR